MMRPAYALAALALLAACHAPDSPTEQGLPPGNLAALRGTWLLVPESSHGDTLVYRRNTYRFKYRPGGRPGFRLGPNGRFTRYDLAPGGGLLALDGTWAEAGAAEVRVHLPELPAPQAEYTLHFVHYHEGALTLVSRP